MNLVIEMETGDPDDFLTLLRVLDYPGINLKAVVLNPGDPQQIGLIRWALERFDRQDVLVGSLDIDNKNRRQKPSVSSWHHEVAVWNPSLDAQEGWRTLQENLDSQTTMFIGAPPRNLGKLLSGPSNPDKLRVQRFVIQGGFAGDSVVPKEHRLSKFEGMNTCPTFNLNGHKRSTERLGACLDPKQLVSKNVCHGMLYDEEFHEKLKEQKEKRLSLSLIHDFMEKTYIKDKKVKALHDPFALCCAIDSSIAQWKEVKMFRIGFDWGCTVEPGSNTQITIAGDKDKFFDVFAETDCRLNPWTVEVDYSEQQQKE